MLKDGFHRREMVSKAIHIAKLVYRKATLASGVTPVTPPVAAGRMTSGKKHTREKCQAHKVYPKSSFAPCSLCSCDGDIRAPYGPMDKTLVLFLLPFVLGAVCHASEATQKHSSLHTMSAPGSFSSRGSRIYLRLFTKISNILNYNPG